MIRERDKIVVFVLIIINQTKSNTKRVFYNLTIILQCNLHSSFSTMQVFGVCSSSGIQQPDGSSSKQ